MREIKFRAWDTRNKRFIGNTKEPSDDNLFIEEIYEDGSGVYEITHWGDMVLQQCTGLKDKNGKEIYEGDICRYTFLETTHVSPVVYDLELGTGHYLKWLDQGAYLKLATGITDWHKIEVIGNIFQPPEEQPES